MRYGSIDPHDFNPLRPCGRRPSCTFSATRLPAISIHSARVGGDQTFAFINGTDTAISIHSARVGGDNIRHDTLMELFEFQSTPPVWAETAASADCPLRLPISIHSARVGGDAKKSMLYDKLNLFQSTPPVWAETIAWNCLISSCAFQSTPPVWAETGETTTRQFGESISIHSARVGGDLFHAKHPVSQ